MNTNKNTLPEINSRVKMLIDELANGNVAAFVRIAGINSHQVLNRIFSIDGRTGKYPRVSSSILNSIKLNLPSVNYDWLLTGEGEMLTPQTIHATNSTVVGSNIHGSGNKIMHNDLSDIKLLVDEMAEQRKANTILMQKKDEQLDKAQSQIDRLLDLLERK